MAAASPAALRFSARPEKLASDGAAFPAWVNDVICEIPAGPFMHAVFTRARAGRAPFTLYVGDLASAHDAAALRAARVGTVVNCCCATCGRGVADFCPHAGLTYALVVTNDHFASAREGELGLPGAAGQDPAPLWPAALLALREELRAGEAALVHCAWGINRSVTTAALFLVLVGAHADFDAAVAAIQAARPQAAPHAQYRAWALAFLASSAGARTRAAFAGDAAA